MMADGATVRFVPSTSLAPAFHTISQTELFSGIGDIKRVKVFFDAAGRSEGAATVDFFNAGDADRAAAEFDGIELDGMAMSVIPQETRSKEAKFTINLGGMKSDADGQGGILSRLGPRKAGKPSIMERLGKKVPTDTRTASANVGNGRQGGGAMRAGRGGREERGRGSRGRGGGRGGSRSKPMSAEDLDMELDSYMTVNS